MAKGRRAEPAKQPERRTRKSSSFAEILSMDSERSARLLLVGGVGLLILIALGFVAFGYWYTEVRPEGRTIIQLDDEKVTYASMKRRMGYELFQNVIYQQSPDILPEAAADNLVEELLVTKRSESALGITATDEELDAKLRTRVGAATGSDDRAYAEAFRSQLDVTGLKEGEFRRMVLAELLQEKMIEQFKLQAPANVLQARLEVIATETEEEAQAAIERIEDGEEFADVAREVSTEADVETTGGVKEYGPPGSFNSAYDNFAFTADVDTLSEPLEAAGGAAYFVVRVTDRSDQPASESHRTTIANEDFVEWVDQQRDEASSSGALVLNWEQSDQDEALVEVVNSQLGRIQAQQRQQAEQQQRAIELQQTTIAQLTQGPSELTPAPAGTPAAGATPTSDDDAPPEPDAVDDGDEDDAPPVDSEAPSAGDDDQ